jgi:hypothetical protein
MSIYFLTFNKMVSSSEAIGSRTRILASLTPEDFDVIQDTLNRFEQRYINESSHGAPADTTYEPVDDELYGFHINHMTSKQRLYLKANGYKVTCRWDRSTGRMICTLNFP